MSDDEEKQHPLTQICANISLLCCEQCVCLHFKLSSSWMLKNRNLMCQLLKTSWLLDAYLIWALRGCLLPFSVLSIFVAYFVLLSCCRLVMKARNPLELDGGVGWLVEPLCCLLNEDTIILYPFLVRDSYQQCLWILKAPLELQHIHHCSHTHTHTV